MMVRIHGGIVEHPQSSALWRACHIAAPGRVDAFGGHCIDLDQFAFGHRASKTTRLYVVGAPPCDVPSIPLRLEQPTHVIGDVGRSQPGTKRPEISKAEREHTPPDFALWLVDLASRCSPLTRNCSPAQREMF
jgi:hypothetical protein